MVYTIRLSLKQFGLSDLVLVHPHDARWYVNMFVLVSLPTPLVGRLMPRQRGSGRCANHAHT